MNCILYFSLALLVPARTCLTKSCFARLGFTKLSTMSRSAYENRTKTDLWENAFVLQDDKYNCKHTFF